MCVQWNEQEEGELNLESEDLGSVPSSAPLTHHLAFIRLLSDM